MLQKLIAPALYSFDVSSYVPLHLGMCRVKIASSALTLDFIGSFKPSVLITEKTHPYSRSCPDFSYFVSKLFHISELFIGKPGTCTFVFLPAVINNLEGSVLYVLRELNKKTGIGDNLSIAALSVGIVPIISAVNSLLGENWIIAKLTAVIAEIFENLTAVIFLTDKGTKAKPSSAEMHTAAAVSHINRGGNPLSVEAEADEGITACLYTEAKALFLIGSNKIPGHPSVILRKRQKSEISVASLPGIAENKQILLHLSLPVKLDKFRLILRSLQIKLHFISFGFCFYNRICISALTDDFNGKIFNVKIHIFSFYFIDKNSNTFLPLFQ